MTLPHLDPRPRPRFGGCDNAATIAPHAVITLGSDAASCGTASPSAMITALVGFAAARTPTIAAAASASA